MRILVTGGGGYIGSILVPTLLEAGHAVTVIDTFPRPGTELAAACAYQDFEPVRGDVRDTRLLDRYLPKFDVVIPLAALVGAPLCARDEIGATTTNRDAIRGLTERLSKDQWLVFPTTNSGYGVGDKDAYCAEATPLNPISLYGRTKVEAEKIVLDTGRAVTLRLATVFGMSPRIRLDLLVNDFTYRAVNDRVVVVFEGHFRRNYIHVRDVAKAFLHVISNYGSMCGEPYNVGLSDANLTKLQLCERIKRYVPDFHYFNAPIGEDPDKRDYIISNAKIEATGFRPDWSLDRGILELIKAYRMLRNSNFSNV